MEASRPLISIILLLTLATPAVARGEDCALEAIVVDSEHKPVSGAVVHLLGADVRLISDEAGAVCAPALAAGRQSLLVIADGFSVLDATVSKEDGVPLWLTLELTPAFGEEMVITGTRTDVEYDDAGNPIEEEEEDKREEN